ncbi:MAG: ABC transporter permease, partial [Maritimibacter sp.]
MTTADPDFAKSAEKDARRARLFTRINKADAWFQVLGLAWI